MIIIYIGGENVISFNDVEFMCNPKDTKMEKVSFDKNGNLNIEDINTVKVLKQAGKILREGGLVAIPTETVYGLAGNALDADSSLKIYAAKGRPSDNPLIVHISNVNQVPRLVDSIPEKAKILMENFWPGPLTIIFNKSNIVPYETTGKLDTVAIRFPVNEVAQKVIDFAEVPLAAPSANISGRPSPTRAEHVKEDLFGKIDMIIDGGECKIGIESTIVDVTGDIPYILRPGEITLEDVKKFLPDAEIDPAVLVKPVKNIVAKAPGMKYRHYAPNASVTIIESVDLAVEFYKVSKYICNKVEENIEKSNGIGIIASEQTKKIYVDKFKLKKHLGEIEDTVEKYSNSEGNIIVMVQGDLEHPKTIAANLFSILRDFNHENVDQIYAEGIDKKRLGVSIRNRLDKAAGYNIIKI